MSITKVTDAGLDRNRIVTPLIINGDMSVAQRATSSTSTGIKTCDRWNVRTTNTDNLALTQAQSSTVPGYGFKSSYKYDTTTAESALASDEALAIETRIEANTMQGLKYGTAQAEATTLSFWCKGSLTGVHGIYIRTHDGAQEFVQSYNIDTADTWEFKTINIPANTSAAINNDTGIGWWIQWGLAAGTGIDGATLGSWHDNATEIFPTNQVNYMANTAYEFLLTGVQLEIGTFDNNTMPAFPFESFDNNLTRCKRYYESFGTFGDYLIGYGYGSGSDTARTNFPFTVEKRSTPSMADVSSSRQVRINWTSSDGTAVNQNSTTQATFSEPNVKNSGYVQIGGFSSIGGGQHGYCRMNNATTTYEADAEL